MRGRASAGDEGLLCSDEEKLVLARSSGGSEREREGEMERGRERERGREGEREKGRGSFELVDRWRRGNLLEQDKQREQARVRGSHVWAK